MKIKSILICLSPQMSKEFVFGFLHLYRIWYLKIRPYHISPIIWGRSINIIVLPLLAVHSQDTVRSCWFLDHRSWQTCETTSFVSMTFQFVKTFLPPLILDTWFTFPMQRSVLPLCLSICLGFGAYKSPVYSWGLRCAGPDLFFPPLRC